MTPAALSRKEAAEFVGLSPTAFDERVQLGEMPRPRRYKTCRRVVWLTAELAAALNDLPVDGQPSPADPLLLEEGEGAYRGMVL